MSTAHEAEPDEPISYEQWGIDFFHEAISEERVLGAVNTIAGQPIDFGPDRRGPGKIAKVRAYGEIGAATATRERGDQISYRVLLPVSLTFEVDLQVETHRFEAELLVPLTLTAVAMSGVRIFIEAQPPRGDEVQVELKAKGLRASVLQRVVGIEGELRRFVAALRAARAGEATRPGGAFDRRLAGDRQGVGDTVPTSEAGWRDGRSQRPARA